MEIMSIDMNEKYYGLWEISWPLTNTVNGCLGSSVGRAVDS